MGTISLERNSQIDHETLSVREINEAISDAVSDCFPSDVWVKGEVQRLRFHSSGHIYFDLVDAGAKGSSACSIPVTLLKWNAMKIKGDLREILVEDREIRIKARPDFYAPYGQMSLAASGIDTAYTLGKIALARRELITKLSNEGILKSNAEIDMAELVTSIALITSIDSAAYHDVIDQLKSSGYGFKITAINALMQGHDSPDSVVSALRYTNNLDVDVVLLCRGGGAKSDLATFDSERVSREIIAMGKPVITGLGHQIDVSVADIVAHSTLKTPTACAQFIIERTQNALQAVRELVESIETAINDRVDTSETRLANISQRLGDATYVLERSSQVLVGISTDIRASAQRAFANAKESLISRSSLISAHDPQRVLERGYSLTMNASGQTIRSLKDIVKDQELLTRLADGQIESKVQKISKGK